MIIKEVTTLTIKIICRSLRWRVCLTHYMPILDFNWELFNNWEKENVQSNTSRCCTSSQLCQHIRWLTVQNYLTSRHQTEKNKHYNALFINILFVLTWESKRTACGYGIGRYLYDVILNPTLDRHYQVHTYRLCHWEKSATCQLWSAAVNRCRRVIRAVE